MNQGPLDKSHKINRVYGINGKVGTSRTKNGGGNGEARVSTTTCRNDPGGKDTKVGGVQGGVQWKNLKKKKRKKKKKKKKKEKKKKKT